MSRIAEDDEREESPPRGRRRDAAGSHDHPFDRRENRVDVRAKEARDFAERIEASRADRPVDRAQHRDEDAHVEQNDAEIGDELRVGAEKFHAGKIACRGDGRVAA